MDVVTGHYANLSDRFGYEVRPTEQFANNLGHAMLNNDHHDSAYALFSLNMQNYPDSAEVYDAMGNYYRAQTDIDQAKEYYAKAIDLGGEVWQEKLDELEDENGLETRD